MYNYVKIITLSALLLSINGCAYDKTTDRATKGALTSGAIGLAAGGPQRAAASAATGAAVRVIGGELKDNTEGNE